MLAIFHPSAASSSLTFALSLVVCFVAKKKTTEKQNSAAGAKKKEKKKLKEAPLHVVLSLLSIAFQAYLSSSPNSVSVYLLCATQTIPSAATAYVNAFINAFPLLFRAEPKFKSHDCCAVQFANTSRSIRIRPVCVCVMCARSDSNIRTKSKEKIKYISRAQRTKCRPNFSTELECIICCRKLTLELFVSAALTLNIYTYVICRRYTDYSFMSPFILCSSCGPSAFAEIYLHKNQ